MQCGPVRYRVDAKQQAAERPFEHKVAFRQTQFRAARSMPGEQVAIQELYAQLAADEARNDLIFEECSGGTRSRAFAGRDHGA